MSGHGHVIAFLDEDHVLAMAANLLRLESPQMSSAIRSFFAPEPVDLAMLKEMAAGLTEADGWRIVCGREPSLLAEAEILVFRRGEIPADLIAAAPTLRLIQRLGEDSSRIDLAAAARRGVAVSCLPRRSLATTADHALMLMLALAKGLRRSETAVRSGQGAERPGRDGDVAYNWPGLGGLDGLQGRTLGLIGLGEVGRHVARRARAFGMEVAYYKPSPAPPEQEAALGVTWRPLAELTTSCEFVSLHAPLNAATAGLFGQDLIARMRADAFLINTSRGALVDEDALFAALSEGRIAGAGLDVHAAEPRPPSDRFCRLENVVLTPHVAAGSRLSVLKEISAMFDNIRAAVEGGPPPHGWVVP